MNTQKNLTRDLTNKWIGGVCAGLARYFEVDVLIVRVLCLILFFLAPATVFVYFLLMVIMPSGYREEPRLKEETWQDEAIQTEGKQTNIFLGLLLITTGIIFLFDAYFRWVSWRKLWPVILILTGLYILIQSFSGSQKEISQKHEEKDNNQDNNQEINSDSNQS